MRRDELEERFGTEGVPTLHELQAAWHVTRAFGEGQEAAHRVRRGYSRLATEGLFSNDDLRRGEGLLTRCGLLEPVDGSLVVKAELIELRHLDKTEACELLLQLFLEQNPPSWLSVARRGDDIHEEYIPDDAVDVLESVFDELGRRDAVLATIGRDVPQEERKELGELGERTVVQACRQQRRAAEHDVLAQQVRQVSRISDHFGYDVSAPRPRGLPHHHEVKTVGSSTGDLQIHISRNQIRVGKDDPGWRLVVCRATGPDSAEIVGWCTAEDLAEFLPREPGGGDEDQCRIRWESLVVRLREGFLTAGLPPLN